MAVLVLFAGQGHLAKDFAHILSKTVTQNLILSEVRYNNTNALTVHHHMDTKITCNGNPKDDEDNSHVGIPFAQSLIAGLGRTPKLNS